MKSLFLLLVLAAATSAGAAETGYLERDYSGTVLQGGAPNGLLSQTLTINSTTIDGTNSIWWSLYSPAACKVRLMPTSVTGSYPQFTAPVGVSLSRFVNKVTPFINFSGCTSGELQRQ